MYNVVDTNVVDVNEDVVERRLHYKLPVLWVLSSARDTSLLEESLSPFPL